MQNTDAQSVSFTCPACRRTSANPNDAYYRYCTACDTFVETDPHGNTVAMTGSTIAVRYPVIARDGNTDALAYPTL